MSRTLRTRATRPNYASLAGLGSDDEGAGPSSSAHIIESDASGSEFEPDVAPEQQAQDDAEDMAFDDDPAEAEHDENESASAAAPRRRKRAAPSRAKSSALDFASASVAPRRKSAQPKAASAKRVVTLVPGLSHPSNRQQHALPSLHHRHRSLGIYRKKGKIERLAQPPVLFAEDVTVQTNACGSDQTVSDRVNKSLGYNIGPGPLWELMEDRTWFKEAFGGDKTTEGERRPRVYASVALGQYQLLARE